MVNTEYNNGCYFDIGRVPDLRERLTKNHKTVGMYPFLTVVAWMNWDKNIVWKQDLLINRFAFRCELRRLAVTFVVFISLLYLFVFTLNMTPINGCMHAMDA